MDETRENLAIFRILVLCHIYFATNCITIENILSSRWVHVGFTSQEASKCQLTEHKNFLATVNSCQEVKPHSLRKALLACILGLSPTTSILFRSLKSRLKDIPITYLSDLIELKGESEHTNHHFIAFVLHPQINYASSHR